MKIHQNKQLFEDAVRAAAQRFNIQEIYIEKDYWVTLALYEIFHSTIATEAVFKGGTALSKCHKLIERFSEDIDIVVLRKEGENDNQLKKKIKAITTAVDKIMPEIELVGTTNKMGQIRKTVHEYSKAGFAGVFGQVREFVILEASWLGNFEPSTDEEVSCYITDLMTATKQDALIVQYNMKPFTVRVLSKERTFCEKIMSLVRFSQTQDPYYDLANKIRHIYDIHMMLKNKEIKTFFESPEFDKMMTTVGKDDVIGLKNNKEWLTNHPSKALIFSDPEATWDKIKNTYSTFKEMVTGELPQESEMITTLKIVSDRLKKIEWKI
ncbi:MAG: nucleotidyl transferase AbiEii/AbiGii toxin family protein [Bacteroidia bacterium]|nr:nucleotidyl transferase AbiEii/AbiGii toxin family protein [Bacteroidia bacterium]